MVAAARSRPTDTAWRLRLARREASGLPEIWALLDRLTDPEIPVVSLWDLGILRDLAWRDGRLIVTITPTYCGCPAMTEIEADIRATLEQAGYGPVEIVTELKPAWSTDELSPEAREALRGYGIAPPCIGSALTEKPQCPRCGSGQTHPLAEFGSTACKALWQCDDCHEAFDYFKPI